MRKVLLSIILLVSVLLVSAQTKDLSQKPTSFNNPEYVYGPSLNSPLSSLSESFEGTTFPPAGWVKANPNGGTGWARITAGTTPVPGFQGGTITPANGSAGTAMAFCSYQTGGATSSDQWLFTPQITNVQPNDSLTFWASKFGNYIDNLHIRISTTTATPAAATIVISNMTFAATDSGWVQYKFSIGNLVTAGANIYIGFRNYCADITVDGASFCLDLVSVSSNVPVELTSFTANVTGNTIQLNWATATETNNRGFEIQKKIANGQYATVAFVNGKGTTTEAQKYSFIDKAEPGTYSYRLRQVDLNGGSEITKSVEVVIAAPNKFELANNYPNPFNPSTKISFNLSVDSKVSLKVYNLLGQEVSSLVNGNLVAGSHEVNFNASNLSTGVYMYKLVASGIDGQNFTSVKKMILNK